MRKTPLSFFLMVLASATLTLRAEETAKQPIALPSLTPNERTFFETKVRPILASACYKCHSVEEKKA